MKTQYTIEKGTHFSRGKKPQPSFLALIPALVGLALNLIGGVSIWYSVVCYVVSAVMYRIAYLQSLFTAIRVVFHDTCIYDLHNADQYDINKLFGFSFGGQDHSARFGWNSNGGKIDIYAYVHKGGSIESKKLISCIPNEVVDLTLKVTDTDYEFSAAKRDGERARLKVQRSKPWNKFFFYRRYPYFGGNQTAPHEMRLEIDYVD